MSAAAEKWAAYAPRVGDPVKYRGQLVGHVTRIDGALCWRSYPDRGSLPFIWCFSDTLNKLHDWPGKTAQEVQRAGGYVFYRDQTGHFGVAREGEPAPAHCAYASAEAIAKLKGVRL
jgi:hypothetical protein